MGIKSGVSLYSLQDEYMNKRMTLAEIIAFLDEHDVEGFEILPDQMLHDTPHPSKETLADWDCIMSKAQVKPVCADVFLNTNLYNNRELTQKECLDLLIEEIKLASRLGFKLIRLVSMVPSFVIEPLLLYAEKYDVAFALEIHAGMSFDIPETKAFIDEMKRVNSPYCGLVIDTGIFCDRIPRVFNEFNKQVLGVNPAIIDYFNAFFDQGLDGSQAFDEAHQLKPELAAMAEPKDMPYIMLADGYENTPLSVLEDVFPYIKHFHFKLWEMTDEGEEYSIDYRKILTYLHEHGYDGYVATEYEGNRWILPGHPMVEKEQVIAHQKLIKSIITELEGATSNV
ncbi:TIM barrel protein [Enterococcus entomosocium]|uniref:TIM barrel protein n=1 Tax=Enterococcus entomosocium TaxID=3034352 RepID=A0ABV3MDS9_9ENTE|nr:TIM barrel protein [Enterococcus casseliflavus]MDB1708849.1 TIM barrel protein [Enterococcus casseliflavus]MDB1716582.1 TIM barrel protein [Enterococcus casseliflavus]